MLQFSADALYRRKCQTIYRNKETWFCDFCIPSFTQKASMPSASYKLEVSGSLVKPSQKFQWGCIGSEAGVKRLILNYCLGR